jgi:DnaJ-class molecular chaperone
MIGKAICPVCNGNGFVRDKKSHPDIRKQTVEQCKNCDSEGEIPITHQNLQSTLWGSQRKQ